jgi:hypothetical protein
MRPHVHLSDEQFDAATWCRHLVPDGSVYAFLADHRQQLFPPELFADLVVQGRSHPSVPAQVVATVMVLQALEGLSDPKPYRRAHLRRCRLEASTAPPVMEPVSGAM